jgi:hypothetical protein
MVTCLYLERRARLSAGKCVGDTEIGDGPIGGQAALHNSRYVVHVA